MSVLDSIGLKLCSFQAELFSESVNQVCSSKVFIRRFMNSDFAARMDNVGFAFESITTTDAVGEIEFQYGSSDYGQIKFSKEELYWIGYMYRYWSYTKEKSSKQVYKLIKPEILRSVYYPYHSLDPEQAINRLEEVYGKELSTSESDIAYGVKVLRRVRKEWEKRGTQNDKKC